MTATYSLTSALSSPNHSARTPGATIDLLVLHHTGMTSGREALHRLCEEGSEVSAHYLVEEDGRVYRLVPETRRAGHAGIAQWRGQTDINNRSIGVEIVNPGHEFGYRPFPAAQCAAVAQLCGDILDRHPTIAQRNVVGHSDVTPWRKADPGELFPWQTLAAAGVGLWPTPEAVAAAESGGDPRSLLQRIGYCTHEAPRPDDPTSIYTKPHINTGAPVGGPGDGVFYALLAFQRRFLPDHLTGTADGLTLRWLNAVAALFEAEAEDA